MVNRPCSDYSKDLVMKKNCLDFSVDSTQNHRGSYKEVGRGVTDRESSMIASHRKQRDNRDIRIKAEMRKKKKTPATNLALKMEEGYTN